MDRLTGKHYDCGDYYMECSGSCANDDEMCGGCLWLEKIINRLGAYEDTGLEPEEITTEPYGCVFYCNRKCNLDGDFCAEGPGCIRYKPKKQIRRNVPRVKSTRNRFTWDERAGHQMWLDGKTDREIAEALGASQNTVGNARRRKWMEEGAE